MKNEVIIFLEKFDVKRNTSDRQMGFILTEMEDEEAGAEFGVVYGNRDFFQKDQRKVMSDIIQSNRPKWVIGLYNSASILLKKRNQRKILINPQIVYNDLNNVSDFDRQYTYGFFDKDFEKDYELFQKVYSNAVWYGGTNGLRLSDIKGVIARMLK